MENTPEAAPQGTEAAPQAALNEPAKTEAPETSADQVAKYLGTDTETLEKFQKFVEANGKFDSAFSKIKADISNPQPRVEQTVEPLKTPKQDDGGQMQQMHEPVMTPPKGAITAQEFLAKQYFESLASEEKYGNISEGIKNGDYLKEMAAFGIQPLNQDGSINDERVRMYLDLKSQTVPAKPTSPEPNASVAPTATYTEVGEGGITSMDQAYKILMEKNNPNITKAEEYIRSAMNSNSQKK